MTDTLSVTFAALADPTRRSILARLVRGEATVGELAEPFDISLPSVSRHLKVLEKAGLVSKGRSAQWRRCRLEPGALLIADAWLEPYRAFFDERFDRLEEQLERVQATSVVGTPAPPVPSAPAPTSTPTKPKEDRA